MLALSKKIRRKQVIRVRLNFDDCARMSHATFAFRGFLLVYVCMPGISGSMFINVDNCRVGGDSGGRGRSRGEATSGVFGIVYTSAPREKAGRRESVCPMTGDWERERAG